MNLFFRILLTIYAFFLTIISIIAIAMTFKPEIYTNISGFVETSLYSGFRTPNLIMFIISAIFLIISLTFLLSGIKSEKDKKAVSNYNNIGEIKISLNSVESIALMASKRLNGVRETKAYVEKINDSANSVSVVIKTIVLLDVNIPALSEDIQIKVKSLVEECTGIKVSSVKVVIENVYTGYKSRVE